MILRLNNFELVPSFIFAYTRHSKKDVCSRKNFELVPSFIFFAYTHSKKLQMMFSRNNFELVPSFIFPHTRHFTAQNKE